MLQHIKWNTNLLILLFPFSGKGPLKKYYQNIIINEKDFKHVRICTPWLEPEDYPRLLGRPFILILWKVTFKVVASHKTSGFHLLRMSDGKPKISKDAWRLFPKVSEDIYRRLSDFWAILTFLALQCPKHLVQQLEVKKAHVLGLLFSEDKKQWS